MHQRIKFQFTPLREGRRVLLPSPSPSFYFNSRPSARGDDCQCVQPILPFISIHAPPRGATCRGLYFLYLPPISIHAPPRGATRRRCPRGWRTYFNSRPSARGDFPDCRPRLCVWHISIHAPPRGATLSAAFSRRESVFQFTPLREGRRSFRVWHPVRDFISIHAPPRGATVGRRRRGRAGLISIHAPPRGAT